MLLFSRTTIKMGMAGPIERSDLACAVIMFLPTFIRAIMNLPILGSQRDDFSRIKIAIAVMNNNITAITQYCR
jgi:hypothetical protein